VDDFLIATMEGLRAALLADPALVALVGDRVVENPEEEISLPYVRFGLVEPVAADTDGTQGATVQVGLVVHSRPVAPLSGRAEASGVCRAMRQALHRKTETVTVAGFGVSEIEVQTYVVVRGKDAATYEGRLALQVHLDA
jgi:hypothetical protein